MVAALWIFQLAQKVLVYRGIKALLFITDRASAIVFGVLLKRLLSGRVSKSLGSLSFFIGLDRLLRVLFGGKLVLNFALWVFKILVNVELFCRPNLFSEIRDSRGVLIELQFLPFQSYFLDGWLFGY